MFSFPSESRVYAVWAVYGEVCGNVIILAIYHYADASHAIAHANRVSSGYVIRSRSFEQPARISK